VDIISLLVTEQFVAVQDATNFIFIFYLANERQ